MFWFLCVCCVSGLSGVAIQSQSSTRIFVKCNEENLDETSKVSLDTAVQRLHEHAKDNKDDCGNYHVHCIGGGGYGWVFSVLISDDAKDKLWTYSKTPPAAGTVDQIPLPIVVPTTKAVVPNRYVKLTLKQKRALLAKAVKDEAERVTQAALEKAKAVKQAEHNKCLLLEHGQTFAVKYYHVGTGLTKHKFELVGALRSRTIADGVKDCLAGSVKYNVPAEGKTTLKGFDVWSHMDALAMHGLDSVVTRWDVWQAHFWFQAMLKALVVQQYIGISHGDMQLSNMMQAKDSNEVIIFDYDTIDNIYRTDDPIESANGGKDLQCLYNEDDWMIQHIPAYSFADKQNLEFRETMFEGGWGAYAVGKDIEFADFKNDVLGMAQKYITAMIASIKTMVGEQESANEQATAAQKGLDACLLLVKSEEDLRILDIESINAAPVEDE